MLFVLFQPASQTVHGLEGMGFMVSWRMTEEVGRGVVTSWPWDPQMSPFLWHPLTCSGQTNGFTDHFLKPPTIFVLAKWPQINGFCHLFYLPRSGKVMQNCGLKKKNRDLGFETLKPLFLVLLGITVRLGKMAQHARLWALFRAKLKGRSQNASNMVLGKWIGLQHIQISAS